MPWTANLVRLLWLAAVVVPMTGCGSRYPSYIPVLKPRDGLEVLVVGYRLKGEIEKHQGMVEVPLSYLFLADEYQIHFVNDHDRLVVFGLNRDYASLKLDLEWDVECGGASREPWLWMPYSNTYASREAYVVGWAGPDCSQNRLQAPRVTESPEEASAVPLEITVYSREGEALQKLRFELELVDNGTIVSRVYP